MQLSKLIMVGATAAILRDIHGNFIAAQCLYIEGGLDVVTMEAMAIRDGLNLANSIGCNNVEAESDSTDIINYCYGQTQWWNAAAAIFAECVDTATSIGKVKFKHCPWTANSVAHDLASYSFCNKKFVSWINESSGWLIETLLNDVLIG